MADTLEKLQALENNAGDAGSVSNMAVKAVNNMIEASSANNIGMGETVQASKADNASNMRNTNLKECPVCKTTLFGDMDICYGCMYQFGSNPDLEMKSILEPKFSSDLCSTLDVLEPSEKCLFNKFLVQFHSFLGNFIADCKVNID